MRAFLILTILSMPLAATAQQVTPDMDSPGVVTGTDWAAGAPIGWNEHTLEQETLDQIILLLSGYEYFPTAEDLIAVTTNPVPYLLVITYDTDNRWLPTHTHRAIGALAYFPNTTTQAQLTYLLTSSGTPELARHHAMNALATGFGEAALGPLEAFLYNDDLQLRLTAVSAISSIASEQSAQILHTVLPIESNHIVRERIQAALASRLGSTIR